MAEECRQCAALQAEVARLKAEVSRLKLHIRRLKAGIRAALRVLGILQAGLVMVIATTGAVLSRKSGVPRGAWSFAKGANRIARRASSGAAQAIAELRSVL